MRRHAFAACLHNVTRSKRGHMNTPARVEITPARAKAPTLVGLPDEGAGTAVATM